MINETVTVVVAQDVVYSPLKINCMINETVTVDVAQDVALSCVTHLTLFNLI